MIDEAGSKAANDAAGEALVEKLKEKDTPLTAETTRELIEESAKPDIQKLEAVIDKQRERAVAAGCEPCVHAAEEGYWGDTIPAGWTHCYECHVSWSGSQVWGHCTSCHQTFRGERAFDDHHKAKACIPGAHRRGTRAKWSGRDYIVKHQEKGDLTYWGGYDEEGVA